MKAAMANSISSISASRVRRVAKEGGWVIAGQLATVLGSLILVRVLTQYLTPAQYGQLALLLTISVLANQFITGGIANGVSRYYSIAAEENCVRSYLKVSARLLIYSVAAVLVLGIILTAALVAMRYNEYLLQVIAVIIFSCFSAVTAALSGILNASRKRAVVAVHAATESWLRIIFIVALIFYFRPSILAVVLVYSLAALFVSGSQYLILKRSVIQEDSLDITPAEEHRWLKKVWAFSWPFCAWGFFTWGQQASDRWALEHFSSTSDVGQYMVVYQLGYVPIGIFTGLVVSYLTPIFYQRYGSGKDQLLAASVHRLAWITVAVCIFLTLAAFAITFFLHEWLFHILVSSSFRSASVYLPWMILAGGIFAAGQMLSLKLLSELKSTAMLSSKIITAVAGMVLNVIFAWKFGAAGVVAALTIFSLVYFLWTAWLAWRW